MTNQMDPEFDRCREWLGYQACFDLVDEPGLAYEVSELKDDLKSELVELDIHENAKVIGKQVVQIGLTKTAHNVLIHRNKKYITATGETVIEGKDRLLVIMVIIEPCKRCLRLWE